MSLGLKDNKFDYITGYRLKLLPDEQQQMRINQILNCCIDEYNWTLETISKRYKETGNFTREFVMNTLISDLYKSEDRYEWTKFLPSSIARNTSRLAIRAYELFFKHVNRFPKFKSRRFSKKSYHCRGDRVYIRDGYVIVEGLGSGYKARIKANTSHLHLGKDEKIFNATVTKDFTGYWLSFSVGRRIPIMYECDNDAIGIDLGLRKRAVLSDGTVFRGPDTRKLNKRIRKAAIRYGKDRRRRLDLSQRMGTPYADIPKTKNEVKREIKHNRLVKKLYDINNTYNHTMTKAIVDKNPRAIVIEDFSARELERDAPWLASRIREASFYKLIHQLKYKAKNKGIDVIVADKSFPSSQMCSRCGNRIRIGSREVYKCPSCGLVIDRDLNEAVNLKNLA